MTTEERQKLAAILAMLGSEHAGERASAGMKAEEFRRKLGLTWPELLMPVVPNIPPRQPEHAPEPPAAPQPPPERDTWTPPPKSPPSTVASAAESFGLFLLVVGLAVLIFGGAVYLDYLRN